MDAVSLVAALAVACENSRAAALQQLLREREMSAMRAADLESHVAQRTYVWSQLLLRPQQLPLRAFQRTWQQAYSELDAEHQSALTALQAIGVANAQGDVDRIAELVGHQFGAAPEDFTDAGAQSDDEQVPRCRRCGDRDNLHLMDQSGQWLDAESEAERTYCTDCLYG